MAARLEGLLAMRACLPGFPRARGRARRSVQTGTQAGGIPARPRTCFGGLAAGVRRAAPGPFVIVIRPPIREETLVIHVRVDKAARRAAAGEAEGETVLSTRNLQFWYGEKQALNDISLDISEREVTAIIGPSGCGKSTYLRCFNRMNELIPTARHAGSVLFRDRDMYARGVDPVEIRKRIGMVFQKPNPFPKSIFENVAYGPRVNGYRGKIEDIVERSLRRAALWDEVKDDLKQSGLALSGGQQQRLCIARALAVEPEVILMDEPCSALDPIATTHIEDLIRDLREEYTIVIVTHNMQQAARVSDRTAFFTVDETGAGSLVEFADTQLLFTTPSDKRTEAYITGRFG